METLVFWARHCPADFHRESHHRSIDPLEYGLDILYPQPKALPQLLPLSSPVPSTKEPKFNSTLANGQPGCGGTPTVLRWSQRLSSGCVEMAFSFWAISFLPGPVQHAQGLGFFWLLSTLTPGKRLSWQGSEAWTSPLRFQCDKSLCLVGLKGAWHR